MLVGGTDGALGYWNERAPKGSPGFPSKPPAVPKISKLLIQLNSVIQSYSIFV